MLLLHRVHSLLGRARKIDIVSKPFPHIVIKNALDTEYYEELARLFPSFQFILGRRKLVENENFRYRAKNSLNYKQMDPKWIEFIRYHTSQAFFDEICRLFGSEIRALHPHIESLVSKKLVDWNSNIRSYEKFRDVALDCQFVTAPPPIDGSSCIIEPHVDRGVALFAGMFYMREDEDDSEGGDLKLYRFKDHPIFRNKRFADHDNIECFDTIKYAKNTLILFIQSRQSVHGVTPRSLTKSTRRYMVVSGEIDKKIFLHDS